MKNLEELNKDIYLYIYDKYFEKFKKITLQLGKQEVKETKEIYNLVLKITDLLYEGNFDLRYFYKDTISERDKVEETIDEMVSKYDEKEYIKINELYNDWRNNIHEIGKYIGDTFEQYVLSLEKENIKKEELKDMQKELNNLKDLESELENI